MRQALGYVAALSLFACAPTTAPPDAARDTPAGDRVAGTVIGPDGNPAAGVSVGTMNGGGERAVTDNRGRFAFELDLPDYIGLVAFDHPVKLGAVAWVWLKGPTENVQIRIDGGGTGTVHFPSDPRLDAQVQRHAEVEAWAIEYQQALAASVEDEQNRVLARRAFSRAYPRDDRRAQLRARIRDEGDPTLRRLATLRFFSHPSLARGFGDSPPDPELARQLLGELKPDSRWWRVAPVAMWNAVTETGEPSAWESYLEVAIANPASPFAAGSILKERFVDSWEAGDIEGAKALAERIRSMEGPAAAFATAELSNFEAAYGALRIGAKAPEFQWATRDAQPVSTETLIGRPYLLYFWAPWCGACKQDVEPLKRLARERNLDIISVALCDFAAFDAFAEQRGPIPGIHVIIPDDQTEDIHRRFTSSVLPTWILVDEEGVIVENSRNFPFSKPGNSKLFEHVAAHL